MKEKMFIGILGGITIIATGISIIYKEIMDKIDGFDKRLKKLEK